MNRRGTAALLVALAVVGGYAALHAGQREIAVLRSFDRAGLDLFTTVWVADDAEKGTIGKAEEGPDPGRDEGPESGHERGVSAKKGPELP